MAILDPETHGGAEYQPRCLDGVQRIQVQMVDRTAREPALPPRFVARNETHLGQHWGNTRSKKRQYLPQMSNN